MSEIKWKIEKHDTIDKDFAILEGDFDNEVCRIDYDDVDHKEQDRLAKFIKSAPEMYYAIKNLLESGDKLSNEHVTRLSKAYEAGKKYFDQK